jgi:hypothetical protein
MSVNITTTRSQHVSKWHVGPTLAVHPPTAFCVVLPTCWPTCWKHVGPTNTCQLFWAPFWHANIWQSQQSWYMVGWKWKKSKAHLKTLYQLPWTPLYIPWLHGTWVPIQSKTVSDSEKKLGVLHAQWAIFLITLHIFWPQDQNMQKNLVHGHSWPEMHGWVLAISYQLFPKLVYGAAAVTHSPQKLEKAFQSMWYTLLPSLCVNRNITKEYRRLPLHYQGLALPNLNIDALSKKVHLLQSHWDAGSTSGRMLHQA